LFRHLYGTSIFRCNFYFLQSIPKKFQLYNVDQKRILRMIFFCLYVDNSTCYVGFNSTMRRHWMTLLVEKCNIGHFCITDIFLCSFTISCENQVIVILWYMTKKTYFSHFIYFSIIRYGIFHTREIRYLTSRRIKFTHCTILTDVFKML
jgi:hypothetical protein